MITVLIFALAGFLAWLAADAWRMRDGIRIPYSVLLGLRGQSAVHLAVQCQMEMQEYEEKHMTGRPNAVYLVFAILSAGFCLAGLLRVFGP